MELCPQLQSMRASRKCARKELVKGGVIVVCRRGLGGIFQVVRLSLNELVKLAKKEDFCWSTPRRFGIAELLFLES